MGLGTRGLGDAGMQGRENKGTLGLGDAGLRDVRHKNVGTWDVGHRDTRT